MSYFQTEDTAAHIRMEGNMAEHDESLDFRYSSIPGVKMAGVTDVTFGHH